MDLISEIFLALSPAISLSLSVLNLCEIFPFKFPVLFPQHVYRLLMHSSQSFEFHTELAPGFCLVLMHSIELLLQQSRSLL